MYTCGLHVCPCVDVEEKKKRKEKNQLNQLSAYFGMLTCVDVAAVQA